jgi:predicted DNA-binding transcriptional regulator YafY
MDNNEETLERSLQKQVKILYTNYRGETSLRIIQPIKIWYGVTNWHTEPQWLLEAVDLEKKANRSFAMKDIRSWFLE